MPTAGGAATGEVIVVTGGGSGLGRAVVDHFVATGARVAVLDIDPDKGRDLTAAHGAQVRVTIGDAADVAAVTELANGVLKAWGRIDSLIGFQGIWDGNRHLLDYDPATLAVAFDEVFHVNVKGALVTARICGPALVRSRGTIVCTLSNAAFMPDGGGPLYVASKHACLGVVRQLAFELAPHVRVNGVAPGGIGQSDLRGPRALGLDQQSQADIPRIDFEALFTDPVRGNPLGLLPDAAAYVPLYALLASREGSATLTGHVIEADQGRAVRGFARSAGGIDLDLSTDANGAEA